MEGQSKNVWANTAEECALKLNKLCKEHNLPILNPSVRIPGVIFFS